MIEYDDLQSFLQKRYNRGEWKRYLINIFDRQIDIESVSQSVVSRNEKAKSIERFATIRLLDEKRIAVLEIKTDKEVQIARNRVALREIVTQLIDQDRYHGLLAFYCSEDDSQAEYRLSFISRESSIGEDGILITQSTAPKRYTYVIGKRESTRTAAQRLKKIADKAGSVTLEDVKEAFSVEALTKEFYSELSNWYFYALKNVSFPDDLDHDTDKCNATAIIRLITRLMFVWFLKQKSLVPDELFEEKDLRNILNDGDSTNSTYYKAILQNLFFATLNNEMGSENRKFVHRQYGIQTLYRYERFFKDKKRFLDLTANIPFLNGGLFENLDKNVGSKEASEVRVDCFSNSPMNELRLRVPDHLFFSDEKDFYLDIANGDSSRKKVKIRGLLNILKSYNFTIEENSPNDVEVALAPELLGKVFENLLAVYNPETETTARKQTGSFYTPREIVHYMVDESLSAYLKNYLLREETLWIGKEKELEEKLKSLLEIEDGCQEELKNRFNVDDTKTLIKAIDNCKIIDPACGSGAFPMGALQKMVYILRKLDPKNIQWREIQKQKAIEETDKAYSIGDKDERQKRLLDIDEAFDSNASDYGRKLYLIENCIFGVDNQPIAVQIAKLRFFISLICEQLPNEQKPNLGIRPLPNLETKFVVADTLISLDKPQQLSIGADMIVSLEKKLSEIRHKHFSARTPETKRKYREKDKELRCEIAKKLEEIGYSNSTASSISGWDPYNQNIAEKWFDQEWMFNIKDGFDIVIGNPPYIQLQKDGGKLSKLYGSKEGEKTHPYPYQTFNRMGDIYSLFYERGYQLLKPQGRLCYITSNKWMRAGYGKETRKFLSENTNPEQLIDFAGVKIFESATVDTNILMFSKDKNRHQTQACVAKKGGIKDLSVFVRQSSSTCRFGTDSWVVLSPIEQRIKSKIEAIGTPLRDWNISINYGIKTGCNEAFIISEKKRRELIEQDPKSEEIIRPILRGKDIKRYTYVCQDLHLINTHNGIKEKGITPIHVDDYPAIKHWLDYGGIAYNGKIYKGYEEIEKRADQGDTPYNLRNCTYMDDFSKQKIVWGEISDKSKFTLDKYGLYPEATTFFLIGEKLSYLLAILNSKLGEWLFNQIGTTTGRGTNRWKKYKLETLLVKIPNEQEESKITQLVDKTINNDAHINNNISEINQLIYKMYDLTAEETSFIDSL